MFDFYSRIRRRIAAHNRRQAALRELAGLDDRQLRDIGLQRRDTGSTAADRSLADRLP